MKISILLYSLALIIQEYTPGVLFSGSLQSAKQVFKNRGGPGLDSISAKKAFELYKRYCSVCHGREREGYGADNAPSLRSHSLIATTQIPKSSHNFLVHTIAYGRSGTAMAPYLKEQGGPLDEEDIEMLIVWLREKSGVKKPIEMSTDPVMGNGSIGKKLYAKHCISCHGANGEGISAPALANPLFLATASDAFIQYTISEGRDGTPMSAYKDSISKMEIEGLTAFIRSRASGWNAPTAIKITEPRPENYVLNPNKKAPTFALREGLYLSAEQLLKAIKDSARLIILDARSKAAWHQTHIPGSISIPYYQDPDSFLKLFPNDGTWIVAYCACPHAVSTSVVNSLRRQGYKNTAVLDEGILVWAQRGYPVKFGQGN